MTTSSSETSTTAAAKTLSAEMTIRATRDKSEITDLEFIAWAVDVKRLEEKLAALEKQTTTLEAKLKEQEERAK